MKQLKTVKNKILNISVRGCRHILELFKQLIQDYVCTPEMPKICANSTELKNVNKS